MNQKSIIIVLGMHRSGTSAITRGLQALQVQLGETLMPAVARNNQKGFWEDLTVYNFHNSLLDALNRTWHTLSPLSAAELTGSTAQTFLPQAVELLSRKLENSEGVFGLKDPRFPQLLPFWQQVFSQLQLQVSYILACRNPKSVAQSLAKRDGFDLQKGYYLWQTHMLLSLNYTSHQNRLVVDFDNVMTNPVHQLERISQVINLSFDPAASEVQDYAENFLESKLRHTRYSLIDVRTDELAASTLIDLYRLLKDLADDRVSFSDPHVETTIEQLTQQFQGITHLMNYLGVCDDRANDYAAQLAESRDQLATLSQSVEDLDDQVLSLNQAMDNRDKYIGELDSVLQERDNQLDQARTTLQQRDQTINQLDHQLAKRESAIAELHQQLTERESAIAELHQQLTERESAIAGLHQQLTERETVVIHLRDQLTSLTIEIDSLKPALQQRKSQIMNLTSSLEIRNAELLAIHQSMSWKMLAPLRAMNLRYPRLARANRRMLKLTWWTVTLQLPARLFPRMKFNRRYFQDIRLIENSQLLDGDWYLQQYPDVAQAGLSPLQHYLQHGAKEGRDPNPLFDSDWYLRQYPDVARIGVNPLRHYIQYGANEGRSPHPLFDGDWYLRQYADVAEAGVNPLRHYLQFGAREGRDPNPLFDGDWYLRQYADVAEAGVNPLCHYCYQGAKEGRNPGPDFDSRWYLSQYSDVARAGLNPLHHYLWAGKAEGRQPLPIVPATRFSWLGGLFDRDFYRANYLAELGHTKDEAAHYSSQGILQGTFPNRQVAQAHVKRIPCQPLISILMPTHNPTVKRLRQAVESLQQQVYENWELYIQDDGSTTNDVQQLLNDWPVRDQRIHVNRAIDPQGIAATVNAALEQAKGSSWPE
jgi:hypothetical protein